MAKFEYTARYQDEDGQWHNQINTLAATKEAFLNALSRVENLHSIKIDDGELKDADAIALARVVAKQPHLQELVLLKNYIGPEGLDALTDAASKHSSLRNVNLSRNCLKGQEGGESAARFMQANPQLDTFNLSGNMLGDDGGAIVADALTALPRVRLFFAAHTQMGSETLGTFADIASRHGSLCSINITQGEALGANDAATIGNMENFKNGPSNNLLYILPESETTKAICQENKDSIGHAMGLLTQELKDLSYAQHCGILERWPSMNYAWEHHMKFPVDTSKKSKEFMREEFPAFLRELPPLPSEGGADALFAANAEGFAPLDNPRIWQNPQAVMDYVDACGQKLDAAFLERKTERNVSFVESAMGIAPAPMMLRLLNEAGIQLQGDALLTTDKKPTPLFDSLIDRGRAASLFTDKNWKGGHPAALHACAAQLPERTRDQIPLHGLAARLNQQQSVSLGNGR